MTKKKRNDYFEREATSNAGEPPASTATRSLRHLELLTQWQLRSRCAPRRGVYTRCSLLAGLRLRFQLSRPFEHLRGTNERLKSASHFSPAE